MTAAARLLVVDDEVANVTALTLTLTRMGYQVVGAHSPVQALQTLRRERFDLLLTDLMMPGMDGIELLRQALAIDANLVGILMTGHATIDSALQAMKSGAHDYILKPFNLNVIIPVLERGLETRRLRVENATLVERLTQRAAELEVLNRALRAANSELDSFAHSVSHDLRTPLHAVVGFAELLSDERTGPLNEGQKGFIEHILEAGRRLSALTEDLLHFSRLGQQPLRKEQIDLNELVAAIVQELRVAHPGRNVEVRIQGLLPAQADPSLIKQVFLNLLSNAFKYTKGVEHAVVDVDSHAETRAEGPYHAYRVRDNGAGFDMRQAKRLFAPFQRLHSTAQFEGTGIGLSLVKRIVDRHGGQITGTGEPGKGAEFVVTLPA